MGGHHGEPKVSPEDIGIQKILAKAETQNFSEVPKYSASEYSGVVPTTLAGPFADERRRLGHNFTEADRLWRIKWHKDQNLRESEPFNVPALLSSRLNPIRRFYRAPLDIVEGQLTKIMSAPKANIARNMIGRTVIAYFGVLAMWYHLNYCTATWEKDRGTRVHYNREVVLPGDIRYPMASQRTEAWQHYDRRFHERKVLLN